MKKTHTTNKIIIILFALVLLLPTIANIFKLETPLALTERRNKYQLPTSSKNLKNYISDLEKYYNDHFGLRKEMIISNKTIVDNLFDVEFASDQVLKGKNNWLFSAEGENLEDFQGQIQLNKKELDFIVNILINEWKTISQKGIKYLFVIIPNKYTIYSEYLPDYIMNNKKINQKTIKEQIVTELKFREPNFPILDITNKILKEKQKTNKILYIPRDTHWNDLGAFIGYQEIIKALDIEPKKLNNFTESTQNTDKGDLADIINDYINYTYYTLTPKNKQYEKIKTDITAKTLKKYGFKFNKSVSLNNIHEFTNLNIKSPKLLMFRDSFALNMFDYLNEHFSRSLYIWMYPCYINPKFIEQENFDIVIRQSTERFIPTLLKKCKYKN